LTTREINERKRVEKELILAKKKEESANKAKSEFLSNMTHELRTPMHQILSYSKFGVSKINKVNLEKLLYYFTTVEKTGNRLMSLLDNLLNLSYLDSGNMEYKMLKNDLKQIVNNVAEEFDDLLNKNGLTLEIDGTIKPMRIVCDGERISQVIRNLIANAIRFTLKDKRIVISFKQNELPIEQYQKGNCNKPHS
jgi:signal transduction histidine kinase